MRTIIQPYKKVALIGRTNVGKSTIFNLLIGDKKALVSNIPGTTRDQRYGECFWQGKTVLMVDTAGLDVESDAAIDIESVEKAHQAIKDADLVLFIVDAKSGLLPQDKEFAMMLKKTHKPVILTINKVDSGRMMNEINDFYKLGFKDVEMVSAKTGAGTGDLLDTVFEKLDITDTDFTLERQRGIRIAIIGKPNVGKSSLLNKIIGENRAIVSPIAHTTRDSQDVTVKHVGENGEMIMTFIDTAGIIKQRKVQNKLQERSIEQSLESLKRCHIALLVIDATEPITVQDKNLSREILDQNKSLIFVVNKWDLIGEKDEYSDKDFTMNLYRDFPYLTWAPIVFVSAKTGAKVDRLVNVIEEIHQSQNKYINESTLNTFVKKLISKQSPRKTKGIKPPHIYLIRQISNRPITFEVIAQDAENLHFSYRRFIANELRKKFGFAGCGIRIKLTEHEKKKSHTTGVVVAPPKKKSLKDKKKQDKRDK